MARGALLSIAEIEPRICDIAAEQLGIDRGEVKPHLRLIQDLHCDSLDLVELLMEIEEAFDVDLPDVPSDPAYKAVFTRDPFRLSDFAELVYLRQGAQRRNKSHPRSTPVAPREARRVSFTQLGGRCDVESRGELLLLEPLGPNEQGRPTYRRRTDGMVCVLVPGGDIMLGSGDDDPESGLDERPMHRARLTAFVIDREPVSTTAYCRFLNSIGAVDARVLEEWFALPPTDKRCEHQLIRHDGAQWTPLPGTERLPMMLVSWFGANAYSLWANRRDWRHYRYEGVSGLPTEAQWEYAARGPRAARFPWGDADASPDRMRYGQHTRGASYAPESMPMAEVNARLGVSPFGLFHMAGNVWQWCHDWYSPDFYATREASAPDPMNRRSSRVRSERGGSWIGPAFLCRSSYRRGRVPEAKGRCLGFRCTSAAPNSVA